MSETPITDALVAKHYPFAEPAELTGLARRLERDRKELMTLLERWSYSIRQEYIPYGLTDETAALLSRMEKT